MQLTLLSVLAVAVTLVSAQTPPPAPQLWSCAAQDSFNKCWAVELSNRAKCAPPPNNTMVNYYSCMCQSSTNFVSCFSLCQDSPDYVVQRNAWVNDQVANCQSAKQSGATTSPTTSAPGGQGSSTSGGNSAVGNATSTTTTGSAAGAKATSGAVGSAAGALGAVAAAAVAFAL